MDDLDTGKVFVNKHYVINYIMTIIRLCYAHNFAMLCICMLYFHVVHFILNDLSKHEHICNVILNSIVLIISAILLNPISISAHWHGMEAWCSHAVKSV